MLHELNLRKRKEKQACTPPRAALPWLTSKGVSSHPLETFTDPQLGSGVTHVELPICHPMVISSSRVGAKFQ